MGSENQNNESGGLTPFLLFQFTLTAERISTLVEAEGFGLPRAKLLIRKTRFQYHH
jgi:hypothetical protein